MVEQNRYYKPMRQRTVVILGLILAGSALGVTHELAPDQSGGATGMAESHEGVTIVARPWNDPTAYRAKFPKKNPWSAGIAAIQMTLQNDSSETIKVNLDRIRLLVMLDEDTRQNLSPLSSEDVADVILKGGAKDPTVRRNKIPLPVGKPRASRTKQWMEIEQAARDAGVPSSVVPPHSKVQGLLYFDIAHQFDLLRSARLYVPEVVLLEKGRSLFYFEIDFSKAGPN